MSSHGWGVKSILLGLLLFTGSFATSVWADESYDFCATIPRGALKKPAVIHVSYRYGAIDLGREHARLAVQSYYESSTKKSPVSVSNYDPVSCNASALYVMRVQDNWPWESWNETWDEFALGINHPDHFSNGLVVFGDALAGEGVIIYEGNVDLWSPVASDVVSLGKGIGDAAQRNGPWISQRLPHVTCSVKRWHLRCSRS
jgi:hypothetical protein